MTAYIYNNKTYWAFSLSLSFSLSSIQYTYIYTSDIPKSESQQMISFSSILSLFLCHSLYLLETIREKRRKKKNKLFRRQSVTTTHAHTGPSFRYSATMKIFYSLTVSKLSAGFTPNMHAMVPVYWWINVIVFSWRACIYTLCQKEKKKENNKKKKQHTQHTVIVLVEYQNKKKKKINLNGTRT